MRKDVNLGVVKHPHQTKRKTMRESIWAHIERYVAIFAIIGGFYTIYTSIDALNCRLDNHNSRMDQFNARMDQLILAWHEESKDFHGRLCYIEAEKK